MTTNRLEVLRDASPVAAWDAVRDETSADVYAQVFSAASLARIPAAGGAIESPPRPEGKPWVATSSDPAGNWTEIWATGPR